MITPKTFEAYQLLHQGTIELAKVERQGFRVHTKYVQAKKEQLTGKIQKNEKEFYSTGFFKKWQQTSKSTVNIYSPLQLQHYLYDVLGYKSFKTNSSGGGAVDEEALNLIDIPELQLLLKIKKLKKIRDNYLDGFDRESVKNRIHPFYNLHIARTYRSSSSDPNFQNIPVRDKQAMKICRQALYPRKGHKLVELDFGSLEVRIAACYHKDTNMLKYINDPTTDMHRDMTQQIFCIKNYNEKTPGHSYLRKATKNGFVFPQFYGSYFKSCADGLATKWGKLSPIGIWKPGQGVELGDGHLSDHLIKNGIKTFGKFDYTKGKSRTTGFLKHIADIEYDFWNNRFRDYTAWKQDWFKAYEKRGYFDNFTGFRFIGNMSRNDAINYPVQSAAFHCLLWSLIEISQTLEQEGRDTKIIGQIHDSIILDVNPNEYDYVLRLCKYVTTMKLLNHWKWINVPLTVEAEVCNIDQPWSEKAPISLDNIKLS